jgi:hypothetical protein
MDRDAEAIEMGREVLRWEPEHAGARELLRELGVRS